MMRMTWRTSIMGALLAFAGSTGAAGAQMVPADRSADEAADLVRQADAALEGKSDWGRAAILYRQAAELSVDEPIAADHHRHAGLLAFYAGREGQAVDQLTRAAETALAWGDVVSAAQSFLDAAWVAHEDGNNGKALDLAQRAERLARSPLMARADRAQLMQRIAEPQAPRFDPDA